MLTNKQKHEMKPDLVKLHLIYAIVTELFLHSLFPNPYMRQLIVELKAQYNVHHSIVTYEKCYSKQGKKKEKYLCQKHSLPLTTSVPLHRYESVQELIYIYYLPSCFLVGCLHWQPQQW